ncbi:M48 family metallopeptidase [Streptomyces sp. NPDC001500]
MTAGRSLRAGRDPSSLLGYAIALAVHGVTATVALAGVWCLVRGWGGFAMAPGVVLLVIAWCLRPRVAKETGTGPVLKREDAPAFYTLIDEVAGVVGTRGVDLITIGTEVNAAVLPVGLRGRRTLRLGLPLWETLAPQQKVALLGHELAHFGNGDTRHGFVVATAYRSLTTWYYFVAPISSPSPVELAVNLLYSGPRLLLRGVLFVLDRLMLQAGQRAEYLADRAAARAGSTAAAVGLMDRLLVTDSVELLLLREANRAALAGGRGARAAEAAADGMWERLTAYSASIPEGEYERQRRVGARRGHSVDSTHPPTHLRRLALTAGPSVAAAVEMDADRERRVAAELAPARAAVARRIVRDGPGDRRDAFG